MRKILFILFLVLILSTFLLVQGWAKSETYTHQSLDPSASSPLQSKALRIPLHFEANQGQTDPEVQFLSHGNGYNLFLTPSEVVLATRVVPSTTAKTDPLYESDAGTSAVLRMRLVGANPTPPLTGEKVLSGKVNYFMGNDPTEWQTNVSTYAQVRYSNVYSGIDLVYYGNQRQLEYDFVVAPGEDPSIIIMNFEGADAIEVGPTGDLLLHTSGGMIRQRKPIIYQEVDGKRQAIQGGYLLKDPHHIGFQVGAYDTTNPLIIDPVLVYSTYLGGSYSDSITDIAVDAENNVYVTGRAYSPDFPSIPYVVVDPPPGLQVGSLVYIDRTYTFTSVPALVQGATYIQTANNDKNATWSSFLSFTVNQDVTVYVAHDVRLAVPTWFATLGLTDTGENLVTSDTTFDLFAASFPTGLIELGGNQSGGSGSMYSVIIKPEGPPPDPITSIVTTNPLRPPWGGTMHVTKFSSDGTSLVYSTYIRGVWLVSALAVDALGNAYLTGSTSSTNFPTVNAFQATKAGGGDAFISKLSADGSVLLYSTYLGGATTVEFDYQPAQNVGNDIAVDMAGNAYVTGRTDASDFPTTLNAFQPSYSGGYLSPGLNGDAFVTKLAPDGLALVYSTYLGGGVVERFGYDSGSAIAVDQAGSAYVTGITVATNFPTLNPFQGTKSNFNDIFLTKLTPDGSALVYSTYLGGSRATIPEEQFLEEPSGIAVDAAGHAYLTGWTYSEDFPTTLNAFQSTINLSAMWAEHVCFITKFTVDGSGLIYSTYLSGTPPGTHTFGQPDQCHDIAIDSEGKAYVTGETDLEDFPTTTDALQATKAGRLDGFLTQLTPDGSALAYSTYLGGTGDDTGHGIAVGPSGNMYVGGQTTSTNFPTMNPFQTFNAGGGDGFVLKIAPDNVAPSVTAGPAQTITLPSTATLDGTVTDDGYPNPPGRVTTIWNKVSGPGTVTFGNAHAVDTTASFSLPGTYALRLTADDGALMNSAGVTITVKPSLPIPPMNQAPTVHAGPDQTIALPNGATLDGTVTDDGLPNPPGVVTTLWIKVSGPGTVTFGNSNAVGTTATFSSVGTYVLRLTATDGGLSTSADLSITVRSHGARRQPTDLNADGTADLLWRNTSTTVVAGWLMNGTTILSSGFFGGVPAQWKIEGIGDVNDDGKADVIWQHASLNIVAIWLMNGLSISSVGFPGGVSSDWKIEGVGDVDGDGKADLIWRNQNSHVVAIWLMNGTTIASPGFFGGVPAQWQIKGIGDVNGDGKADVIWQHTITGTVAVWIMNGLTITNVGFPASTSMAWNIEGVGDVNGDGKEDLIWKNDTSDIVAIWLMNGASIGSSGIVGGLASAWTPEQVGDSNGDGKADIVWRNGTTGAVDMWLMNGLTITTTGSPGAASTDWEIQ